MSVKNPDNELEKMIDGTARTDGLIKTQLSGIKRKGRNKPKGSVREIDQLINDLEKIKNTNMSEQDLKALGARLSNLYELKTNLQLYGFEDINSRHPTSGKTPLTYFMGFRNDLFEILIKEPSTKVNLTDKDGRTPIWWAANNGNLQAAEMLGSRSDVDYQKADNDQNTPLRVAVTNNFSNMAAFIVKKITGFSIYEEKDFDTNKSNQPLHNLCASIMYSNKTDERNTLLETFKKNNVSLDLRDEGYNTPLMHAARAGNLSVIDWLLKNNADPSLTDHQGNTFLDYLTKKQKEEIQPILIEHNINTRWDQDLESVKSYGHVLGIGSFLALGKTLGVGGVIEVPMSLNGSKSVSVFTEGWSSGSAYKELSKQFSNYQPQDSTDISAFEAISAAMHRTNEFSIQHELSSMTLDNIVGSMTTDYEENKPVIIPVGFGGHMCGLAIYKDKLIYTDRFLPTGGLVKNCTNIYQLNTTDKEAINSLIQGVLFKSDSQEELLNALSNVVDLKNPILRVGDSAQTHGTCSYSNPRSNVEGLLCVLKADTTTEKSISTAGIHSFKKSAHHSYKTFSNSIHTTKIDDLIKDMADASKAKDAPHTKMYYQIATSYIKGHGDKNKNHGNDWSNCVKLYNSMPPDLQNQFNQSYPLRALSLKYALYKQKRANAEIEPAKTSKPPQRAQSSYVADNTLNPNPPPDVSRKQSEATNTVNTFAQITINEDLSHNEPKLLAEQTPEQKAKNAAYLQAFGNLFIDEPEPITAIQPVETDLAHSNVSALTQPIQRTIDGNTNNTKKLAQDISLLEAAAQAFKNKPNNNNFKALANILLTSTLSKDNINTHLRGVDITMSGQSTKGTAVAMIYQQRYFQDKENPSDLASAVKNATPMNPEHKEKFYQGVEKLILMGLVDEKLLARDKAAQTAETAPLKNVRERSSNPLLIAAFKQKRYSSFEAPKADSQDTNPLTLSRKKFR